jgi:lipopolysaccharide biosynthesis glycosyltransferase
LEKQPIHIAITLNEKYLIPACVMLTSLQENNPQQTFQIHIITDFKSIKLSLLKSVIRRYGNSFSVYCLDDAFIGRMKHFKLSNHAQLANYYRLFLTEILDEKIDKVLYLDVDMIVLGDVSVIYDVSLEGKAVAAVSATTSPKETNEWLAIPEGYEYFNSGVLLVNLAYFRREKLAERFTEYVTGNAEKIKYWDQDVLNALLYDKRVIIGKEWNVDQHIYALHPSLDVKIIHFTGTHKPWNFPYCTHPLRAEYFKYLGKNRVVFLADKILEISQKVKNRIAGG